MIVTCGKCNTNFKIAAEKIASGGVKVRCSKCKHVFVIKKGGVIESDPPSSPSLAPDDPGLSDDIFSAPTKVCPIPTSLDQPSGREFPLQPPSTPGVDRSAGKQADSIATDTESPPPKLPPKPPPLPGSSKPGISPQTKPGSTIDDPFAEIASPDSSGPQTAFPSSTLPEPPENDPLAEFDLDGPLSSVKAPDTSDKARSAPVHSDSFRAAGSADQADSFSAASSPGVNGPSTGSDPFAGFRDVSFGPSANGPAGLELDKNSFATGHGSGIDGSALAGRSGLELDQDEAYSRNSSQEIFRPEDVIPKEARKETPIAAASVPSVSLPMAAANPVEPASSPGVLWQAGFWVLLLVVGLVLFVTYRSDGKPDFTSWSTYVEAFTGRSTGEQPVHQLQVVKVANTAYTNQRGHNLVLLWGEVHNPSEEEKASVVVSGKMLNQKGEVVSQLAVPAGISFNPQEVFDMRDRQAVAVAYRSKLPGVANLRLPPRGSVPFMLVFYDHPTNMEGVRFWVEPRISDQPLLGLPSVPDPDERLDRPERSETQEEIQASGTDSSTLGAGRRARLKRRKKSAADSNKGSLIRKRGNFVRFRPKADSSTLNDSPAPVP